jgi:putative glutamine amidotransferase
VVKPLIGITTKTRFSGGGDFSSNTEIHYSPIDYIRSVDKAGGVPILIPMVASEEAADLWLARLDGVILSGGMDVDPNYYGQEPVRDLGGIDGAKDDLEMMLIPKLFEKRIPTLAICRGIQAVNVSAGGTLFQDVKIFSDKVLKHSQRTTDERPTHSITIEPDSWMEKVFGTTSTRVNSYHHQSVDRVAEGFRVTAKAPDGIIEAMEHTDHPYMMCVQFHPELMTHLPEFNRLFVSHVEACR